MSPLGESRRKAPLKRWSAPARCAAPEKLVATQRQLSGNKNRIEQSRFGALRQILVIRDSGEEAGVATSFVIPRRSIKRLRLNRLVHDSRGCAQRAPRRGRP